MGLLRASGKGSRSSTPDQSKVFKVLICYLLVLDQQSFGGHEARSSSSEAALKRAGLAAGRPGSGCCGLHAPAHDGGSSCAREAQGTAVALSPGGIKNGKMGATDNRGLVWSSGWTHANCDDCC